MTTNRRRPLRTDDWGISAEDYRETSGFRQLREKIKQIIAKHQPVTSRAIKAHLGDSHDPRRGYTESALDNLTGEIEKIQKGELWFYVIAGERRRAATRSYHYNNRPVKTSSRIEPYALLDGLRKDEIMA